MRRTLLVIWILLMPCLSVCATFQSFNTDLDLSLSQDIIYRITYLDNETLIIFQTTDRPENITCSFLSTKGQKKRDDVVVDISGKVADAKIVDVDQDRRKLLYIKTIGKPRKQGGIQLEKVQFWAYDLLKNKEEELFEKKANWNIHAQFMPDEEGLFFIYDSNSIFQYSFSTRKESVFYTSENKEPITGFRFFPQLERIFLFRKDGEASIVDMKTKTERRLSGADGVPFLVPLSLSPDGRFLAYSPSLILPERNIWVLDVETLKSIKLTSTIDLAAAWSPDGKKIALIQFIPDHPEDPQNESGIQKLVIVDVPKEISEIITRNLEEVCVWGRTTATD